jgi:hypothetical protein
MDEYYDYEAQKEIQRNKSSYNFNYFNYFKNWNIIKSIINKTDDNIGTNKISDYELTSIFIDK